MYYSLYVCPKFISNLRVLRKIEVRIFKDFLLSLSYRNDCQARKDIMNYIIKSGLNTYNGINTKQNKDSELHVTTTAATANRVGGA